MKRFLIMIFGVTTLLATGCNAALVPGAAPTPQATAINLIMPSPAATLVPTAAATTAPTNAPTSAPTTMPTTAPTVAPTSAPTTASTVAPTAQPSALSPQPSPAGNVATFTSQKLGISFNTLTSAAGQMIATQESGDKVYVYAGNTPPTQGQYVQVFNKDANASLEDAIRNTLLKGYSAQDCPVMRNPSPVAGQPAPASYLFAQIQVPRGPNDNLETLSAKAAKCPQPYAAVGGIAYFLGDTTHPDKFVFFSIGQYFIPGGANNVAWQSTLKFLSTPSAAATPLK